ncbi:MAG TPA: cytochrome c nitrite reductase small subunit [Anaerolineales bacterium]
MHKLLTILALMAAAIALGFFVYVTDAPAYAGNAPETCNNCHVMDAQYENWGHGPHEDWAKCTDCHLPHDNPLIYYIEKGRQGIKDTYAFTTGNIPIAIRANNETKQIVQANCIHCHQTAVEEIMVGPQPFDRYCWDCHRSVAHGSRGISIVPYQDSISYPAE